MVFLASRGIVEGNYRVNNVINKEEAATAEDLQRLDDKAMFGGQGVEGKTIGVIGLDTIGKLSSRSASTR